MRLYLLLFLGVMGGFRPPPLPEMWTNIDCNQIRQWIDHESDTVYLLHFWGDQNDAAQQADLAYFESLRKQVTPQDLRIILISLDLRHSPGTSRSQTNTLPLYHFNYQAPGKECEPNWANFIYPGWTGEMPATFICPRGKQEPIPFVNIYPAADTGFQDILWEKLKE